MRIVVSAVGRFCSSFIPACPTAPVEGRVIRKVGKGGGVMVENALLHSVLLRAFLFILDIAPQHAIDKFLELLHLFFLRLTEFFHGGGQPGSGATFVAEPGDPGASILSDDSVVGA